MNKVLNFISENNIEPSSLFQLVEKVQTMDLSSDESIRKVVRDVSKLANRPISQQQENKINNTLAKKLKQIKFCFSFFS